MKIMICTTPIRPEPTDYPPFGSLAIIQSLQNAGFTPYFYDIDGTRPEFEVVIQKIKEYAPDVIGISAVVSTAYGYVNKLCKEIHKILPEVKIILGGNLAASAEILHKFCGIDVCVIGEGEKVIVNLINYYLEYLREDNYEILKNIKGITFLNDKKDMIFTGYELAIPAEEFLDPDFEILEKYSNINNFVLDPFTRPEFAQDKRSFEPNRRGKKAATVVSTKGCVARCTFCHRWDRGFRQIPPQKVFGRIKYLIDKYNVGFVYFGDENFGSDKKATEELIELIKPLNILWSVAGVRARTVEIELLNKMYNAGCTSLYYGFETGSPGILEVMEKKLKLEDNYNAAKWTFNAGLFTIYQLVLGMPGENNKTIKETTEMLKKITEFLPSPPINYLSINYIQALPGTPVYEYARLNGLIGTTLVDEENYLLKVSDINANDDSKFINFTSYPYLVVRTWRLIIIYEVSMHWLKINHEKKRINKKNIVKKSYNQGGYFNIQSFINNYFLFKLTYPFRKILIWGRTLFTEYQSNDFKIFIVHIVELLKWLFIHKQEDLGYKSLRKAVKESDKISRDVSEESMKPLRLGR